MGISVRNVAAAVAGNVAAELLSGQQGNAGVAELAYATDLKSVALTKAYGFKSRRQHHLETPSISDLKSPAPHSHDRDLRITPRPVRLFLAGFSFISILPQAGRFQSDGSIAAICCGNIDVASEVSPKSDL